jgi:transcriptional regulator GlxA family with amidase domain
LYLVGLAGGTDLRAQCAKIMLVDPARNSQAPYAMQVAASSSRPAVVERAWEHLNQRLHDPSLTIDELASHCAVSQRTLLRRFQESLQQTPQSLLRQLRVERARNLLETTRLPADMVALRCGYNDAQAFADAFRRETSLTPTGYRGRFGLAR